MKDKEKSSKIVVVGEFHQDLTYKTNAFSEIIDGIVCDMNLNKEKIISNPDNFQQIIRDTVVKAISETSKKYDGESIIKRGGNGHNSAILLAKINIPTGLLSVVGKGAEWMINDIKELGVDTSTVLTKKEEPTPISTVIEDKLITKLFIARNLKKKMDFEGIDLPNDIYHNVDLVFFTPMAFKYKHLFDVAFFSEKLTAITIELQKLPTYSDLENCISNPSEFLFCNLDDGFKICQSKFDINLDSKDDYIEKLVKVDNYLKKYAKVRVYTLGKHGSWVRFSNKTLHHKIINVEVKNRTGAGDTFAAGFLAKLYESIKSAEDYRKKTDDEKEWIFKVCLLFATSAAAVKISKGLAPTREEIIKMLEKNEN